MVDYGKEKQPEYRSGCGKVEKMERKVLEMISSVMWNGNSVGEIPDESGGVIVYCIHKRAAEAESISQLLTCINVHYHTAVNPALRAYIVHEGEERVKFSDKVKEKIIRNARDAK